jgi:hypothetical protein
MIDPPIREHWDVSRLSAHGRAYLEANLSFEAISAQVMAGTEVVRSWIEDYETAPASEKDGRRVIFLVRIEPEASDLLYNAPDGLRGRYWQSPDRGDVAKRTVINGLVPKLTIHAGKHPPTPSKRGTVMTALDIRGSLERPSAKIWPREKDDSGQNYLLIEADRHLWVPRWANNEENDDRSPCWWRRDFSDLRRGEWEIKGAFISVRHNEHVPMDKLDRSHRISCFGFT